MNKSLFISGLYFGTETYLIKGKAELDVFFCLAKGKGAERLIKRYEKDLKLLIDANDIEIRFSEFKDEAKSLYPIFLYKKSNKLFRFNPVKRRCEECSSEIYGGEVSSFDVKLGIENKSAFLLQQSELEDSCCFNCGTKIENIKFILKESYRL
ncbi:hypothetical protein PPO43_13660 [Saprospira sp. CCB-QB6]|uniref:hypothetical protein n=1 Tax=Saprospira sp. CCB-QB6 TaxID=3023936 RepID=UPI00234927F4|nr:hypothetical protein [Saprospira sp. CCB-QB6]WCL81016.1 hypothetical protein PPO43_13660 [Saprospira sp. CCB-QB6]